MKIISDDTILRYKDLHIGNVFEYNSNYYMVVELINALNNQYKAIQLKNGCAFNFSGGEAVKLCEATLHIKSNAIGKGEQSD